MSEAASADETGEADVDAADDESGPDLTAGKGGFSCIAKAGVLEDFFEPFETLVEEMKVRLRKDGIYGIVVDPANVGMVEHSLESDAFEHYSSTGGVIGLDLSRMSDVLSLADSDDSVQLELNQETRKLEIKFGGLEYTLALIDPDSIRQEPEIPELDLPAKVLLEGKDLNRSAKATDMVTNHIRTRIGETDDGDDALIIEGKGDTDNVQLELTREDVIDLQDGDADALFSLDYVKDMISPIGNRTEVELELGEQFPMKIHFANVQTDGEWYGDVTMMLAPRVTSD